jgi:SAM-dependent methyltransferase
MRFRSTFGALARRLPLLGGLIGHVRRVQFRGSAVYWERRYRSGGTSGAGSTGRLGRYKANFLNDLVRSQEIGTVLEFGCGDGVQLELAEYPSYIGVDVSGTAIERCRARFAGDTTKTSVLLRDLEPVVRAELVLSLDVIYHLVEDDVYEEHVRAVFSRAERLVVLYTSDRQPERVGRAVPHVRHRTVQRDVARLAPLWRLATHVPSPMPYDPADEGTTFAEFLVYEPRLSIPRPVTPM